MAITIPQSIRDKLGEQASQDLAHLLDQTMAGEKLERLSFDMEMVKRDIARLSEGQDKLNQRFEAMEARFDERFDQMNRQLLSSIRWTVGTIALFGTLITILMAVAEFAG